VPGGTRDFAFLGRRNLGVVILGLRGQVWRVCEGVSTRISIIPGCRTCLWVPRLHDHVVEARRWDCRFASLGSAGNGNGDSVDPDPQLSQRKQVEVLRIYHLSIGRKLSTRREHAKSGIVLWTGALLRGEKVVGAGCDDAGFFSSQVALSRS
jgi:hypothetical protein